MRRIVWMVIGCFSSFLNVWAQDEFELKERVPTLALSVVPQTLAYNTAELNLDVRVAERNWLTFAPCFQFASDTYGGYCSDASDAIKSGFGLGISYRYYPLTRYAGRFSDGKGAFVSIGVRGLQTEYQYAGNTYEAYYDDYGYSEWLVSDGVYKDRVRQFGLDLNMGYLYRFFDILFFEGYVGMGSRFSNYTYNQGKGLNLGANRRDTGFSGYCFTGGVRLGLFLNRFTRK